MIWFPNEYVNVNKLDTYQHILTCWLSLQRLSQKINGKVNLKEAYVTTEQKLAVFAHSSNST